MRELYITAMHAHPDGVLGERAIPLELKGKSYALRYCIRPDTDCKVVFWLTGVNDTREQLLLSLWEDGQAMPCDPQCLHDDCDILPLNPPLALKTLLHSIHHAICLSGH